MLRGVPTVVLRSPLSTLAGSAGRVPVAGATVSEALVDLERRCPGLRGWVIDEHGRIREHVNVFVNGSPGEALTPIAAADTLHVLSAISGG